MTQSLAQLTAQGAVKAKVEGKNDVAYIELGSTVGEFAALKAKPTELDGGKAAISVQLNTEERNLARQVKEKDFEHLSAQPRVL